MSEKSVRGYWCLKCKYGSPATRPFQRCPQCGAVDDGTTSQPYKQGKPEKGMGSGQPTGKTARKHARTPRVVEAPAKKAAKVDKPVEAVKS